MKFIFFLLFVVVSFTGVNVKVAACNNSSKLPAEIIQLRTERQKVFRLENGNLEYRIYSNPIHYFDGNKFEEITNHNTISRIENENKSLKMLYYNDITNKSSCFENTHVYKDLVSVFNSNQKILNFDLSGRYTQLNNEYMITNDEYYIFPESEFISSLSTSDVAVTKYDTSIFSNNTSIFPITLVNESTIIDNYDSIIKDKFITIGLTGSNDSSVLLAGTDRLQFVDPDHHLVNAQYVSIIELTFPSIDSDDVVSVNFNIFKDTTTNDVERNPLITLNKITSNIDYDDIDGTSEYEKIRLATGFGIYNSYSFDITNSAIESIENNTNLLMSIEGSSSGYASFYSSNAASSACPYVSIEVVNNELGGTLYGNAPIYRHIDYGVTNCLGYVLLEDSGVDLILKNKNYSSVFAVIESVFNDFGYSIRELDSYDSDIYIYERRIAFRYEPKNLSSWHFIMQTSDGAWAAKFGMPGQTGLYPIGMNPNDEYMWYIYEDLRDETTHYYAISEL